MAIIATTKIKAKQPQPFLLPSYELAAISAVTSISEVASSATTSAGIKLLLFC